LITRLCGEGHAIVLISHNLSQVLKLSDAVWIMRSGRCVAGRRTSDTDGDVITGTGAGDQREHQGARS
jgi:simple sugar transport system ATP-binding protein